MDGITNINRKIFSNLKILFAVAAVIIASITYVIFFQVSESESFDDNGIPKAAIIDQLYDEMPNPYFQKQATEYLEIAGYQVDIFTTKDITVDFYKKLPQMNYKFIVIRTHGTDDKVDNDVVLFTGERYNENQYISEQLLGQVKKATPLLEVVYSPKDPSSKWIIVNDTYRYQKNSVVQEATAENKFFAISPKLINDSLVGKFQGTVFLLAGCDTLTNPSMAKALIKRGASAVIGWDNTISNFDNDSVMLELLRTHLTNGLQLKEAVEDVSTRFIYHEAMAYPANLTYFSTEMS